MNLISKKIIAIKSLIKDLNSEVATKTEVDDASADAIDSTYSADKIESDFVKKDGSTPINFASGSQQIGDVDGGNYLEIESDGTVELFGDATAWDDMRVTPGSFDRPGSSDPVIKEVTPGGSGTTTWLYEFAKNNIASFTIQLPHSYKTGSDIKCHIHWTPGARGNEENGALVGWKIDYAWASINGKFESMATLDLSDACNGVDWEHNMSPDIVITGTGKGISSMLICNIKRTDTGTDDTWASTTSGQLPLLLEIDFHYQIDGFGSREASSKL